MTRCTPADRWKINLTTWNFAVGEAIFDEALPDPINAAVNAFIGSIVTPVIKGEFEGNDEDPSYPDAMLPIQYGPQDDGIGGAPVDNPLMIYFGVPLGSGEDLLHFKVTLSDLVDEVFDYLGAAAPPYFDKTSTMMLQKLAEAFRTEAARIEDAIANGWIKP